MSPVAFQGLVFCEHFRNCIPPKKLLKVGKLMVGSDTSAL
jgi:hypothetical protein